jgi:hypothetical protein
VDEAAAAGSEGVGILLELFRFLQILQVAESTLPRLPQTPALPRRMPAIARAPIRTTVLIALEHHVSIEFLGIRSDPTDDHTPEVRANDIETS